MTIRDECELNEKMFTEMRLSFLIGNGKEEPINRRLPDPNFNFVPYFQFLISFYLKSGRETLN